MKIQSFHRLLNYFLLSLKNDIKHFIRFIGYFYKYPNVKFHYSTVIYSSAILEIMLWDKEVDLKDIWDMARIYKMIVTLVGK